MISNKELEKYPNYLLTSFQLEIYKQLKEFMDNHRLSQSDVAKKLGVSNAYVSQILNGNFNFTLKKLIELGLMIGKVPDLEFITFDEYWRRESAGRYITNISVNIFHTDLLKKSECADTTLATETLTGVIVSSSKTIVGPNLN